MYRAFALKALRAALPLEESSGLERLAAETSIRLDPGEEENRVLLDDEDVTGLIRNPTVTEAASRVSVFPGDSRLDGRACSSSWALRAAW